MSKLVHHQSGVVSEPTLHGLTLLLRVKQNVRDELIQVLNRYPEVAEQLEARFSDAMLSLVIAFGDDFWHELYPDDRPDELKAGRFVSPGVEQTPTKHFDIALVLRSDRVDANYEAARSLLKLFNRVTELEVEIPAFRYLDGRNLFGFHSTPKIPHGVRRREITLVPEGPFAGGSYLWIQFSRANLAAFEELSPESQELRVGQNKLSGKPVSVAVSAESPEEAERGTQEQEREEQPHTHYHMSQTKEEDEFWRLHMPVADMRVQGEISWYWSRDLKRIRTWLEYRHGVNDQQRVDPMLEFSEQIFNATFFAPSLNFLQQLSLVTAEPEPDTPEATAEGDDVESDNRDSIHSDSRSAD